MRAIAVLLIHGKGKNENITHTNKLEPSTGVYAQLQKLLFPSDDEFLYRYTGYKAWDDEELLDDRHSLLEFVFHIGKRITINSVTKP